MCNLLFLSATMRWLNMSDGFAMDGFVVFAIFAFQKQCRSRDITGDASGHFFLIGGHAPATSSGSPVPLLSVELRRPRGTQIGNSSVDWRITIASTVAMRLAMACMAMGTHNDPVRTRARPRTRPKTKMDVIS